VTKLLKIMSIFVVSAVFGLAAQAQSDKQRSAIEARIKPAGEVCLQGDSSCGGAAVVAGGAPRSGDAVYNAACVACHSSGAAGAPIVGDANAWAARIAKGRDVLHDVGINGLAGTGMIAKGGCMNCSDEEIIAAVDYMIDNSK